MRPLALSGMPAFAVLSMGQGMSNLGTGMTAFAITIWAWELTGQATALALVGMFAFLPQLIAAPFAGALVDRLDRKLVMALSDLAAGVVTIGYLVLHLMGALELWHLYVGGAVAGAFAAFQFPAFSAATSTMIPKEQYARASGMLSLAETAPGIAAPILAGVLLALIGFAGILVIDIVTFGIAITSLLFLRIPATKGRDVRATFWSDASYGFRYIAANRSLLGLQAVFFFLNLVAVLGGTVLNPMILARTGNDQLALGLVQTIGAAGGVVGGVVLSLWGGARRRINMLLGGMVVMSVFGQVLMGLGRGVVVWGVAAFIANSVVILVNGANQAIWQSKVVPSAQGRVFAARAVIARMAVPLAMLLAGPLADRVLEPGLMAGGVLVPVFGPVVGTGPGAGMGLMLVLSGCVSSLVALAGYAVHFIRNVEVLVPDHQQAAVVAD